VSTQTYDVIVAGLGAMGSATTCELAARGSRVLGLDRFSPPHTLGSTHGQSRIIREAYYEHPTYVPLVRRAYERWAALERTTGRQVLIQTGGLSMGRPESSAVVGARTSAIEHGIPYEELSAAELRRRLPVFAADADTVAIWEPRAGVLLPEVAIEAHLQHAARLGAMIRCDEPVIRWRAEGEGRDEWIAVTTPRATYYANRLVLTVGAWTRELLPDLELPLVVERQVMLWFRPVRNPVAFTPARFPVFIWEYDTDRFWFGLPDIGDGLKLAVHHDGESTTADTVRRVVTPEDVAPVRALVRQHLPDIDGAPIASAVCLYTDTPDLHFLIDRHPAHAGVILATPCSGHGFKFASALGEVLADLALTGKSAFDLSLFRLDRFARAGRAAPASPAADGAS